MARSATTTRSRRRSSSPIDPEPKLHLRSGKAKAFSRRRPRDLKVDLSVADAAFTGAVDAALLCKEHAKAAGIDINVVREPDDGYWDNVWLKKPFVASYWSGRPTCDWMFTTAYAADAAWNDTIWKNPRFNELLLAARSETDDAKRAAMYAEMQQLVHDDGGLISPGVQQLCRAPMSNKLAHGEIAANWHDRRHEDRRALVVRLHRGRCQRSDLVAGRRTRAAPFFVVAAASRFC